ncbi:MAG: hypothetical protein AABY07_01195 [Nanoarchaeota archaeon]
MNNRQKFCFEWQERNFPNTDATEQLLGVMEEVGELTHAHLKGLQKIRHTPQEIREKKIDSVGDILVYLANYCSREDLVMEKCWDAAIEEIKKRDWINNPLSGKSIS